MFGLGRRLFYIQDESLWNKISSFSVILFFILLGDAILSFWIPNFLQDALKSPFLMGLVMSFSSLIGFLADLTFPQLLRNFTVRRLLFYAIMVSFTFIGLNFLSLAFPILIVFLLSMAMWGIYYEFMHFASQQFVADSVPSKLKSSTWAIIGIFRNITYFLGPLLASILIIKGETFLLTVVLLFALVSLFVFMFSRRQHERQISFEAKDVSIFREISYWSILFPRVWPIIILSLLAGLIDATFWTTGAVWTETLSKVSFIGNFLLPAYMLPPIFMGIAIAKWGIYKGKKILSEKFLFLAGSTLFLLIFEAPTYFYIFVIFLSSIFLAIAFPLIEAVYSDITARMGIERKHLVGLSASTISIAYIISPTVSGYIASFVGERQTFAVIGFIVALASFILLWVTPKKIKLPEKKIASWRV